MLKFWPIGFLLFLLVGCKSLPKKPQPPIFDRKAQFSVVLADSSKSVTRQSTTWWNTLDDNLQNNILILLRDNPTIRLAQTQIDEAKGVLLAEAAQEGLSVDANTNNQLEVGDNKNNRQSLVFDFSLPLDLFNQLSEQQAAANHVLAQRLAEFEQIKQAQIEAYLLAILNGMQAKQTEQLIQAQINTAQTLLQLTELRFAQGLASSIDVLQQREQLAALRQQIPPTKLQQRLAHNEMMRLLGKTPIANTAFPEQRLIPLNQAFAFTQPEQLLNSRADLLAKRAALAAQNSEYAALLAQRLPTLNVSLQGLLSLSSGDLSDLLSAAIHANLNLLDNGRWQGQVMAQNAQLKKAGIEYLSAWLDAVRQVDDLLNQAQQNQATIDLAKQRLRIAEQLFVVSKQVYTQGTGDYLPVLSAVRTLQQQQREYLNLTIEQQRIQIRLHTALGR